MTKNFPNFFGSDPSGRKLIKGNTILTLSRVKVIIIFEATSLEASIIYYFIGESVSVNVIDSPSC